MPRFFLCILLLFLTALFYIYRAKQSELFQEKELELSEGRMAIMLSQIQPHFLYNSFVAIKQLCDINPKAAKDAVTEFSDYLRGNLDSLTLKTLILFNKELKHIENYLALEKRRFGDKLKIVYDFKAQDFMLPALTLQPIVENAVRYGVTKKEEGGTVIIETSETETHILIKISDDGVGFNLEEVKQDGRSHIGIENVRNRLSAMCNGTLRIESEIDVGTTATISIPKESDLL